MRRLTSKSLSSPICIVNHRSPFIFTTFRRRLIINGHQRAELYALSMYHVPDSSRCFADNSYPSNPLLGRWRGARIVFAFDIARDHGRYRTTHRSDRNSKTMRVFRPYRWDQHRWIDCDHARTAGNGTLAIKSC